MKILYLCPDLGIPVLGRKGASVHVRELVSAFARAGHNVVLAAQVLNKSPWESPAEIKVPLVQIRPDAAATAAVLALKEFNERLGVENSLPGELRRILHNKELEIDLKRRFENDPPDFIYERASLYATAGINLAQALRVPVLLELNAPLAVEQATYRSTGFGPLASEAERWTLSHADAVIAVSSLLREHVLSLGVPAQQVHVIPNGVDPALFHPADPLEAAACRNGSPSQGSAVRAKLNFNGARVIGFVGSLRPWHGVEVLPELLQRLSARDQDVRLLIVGDGPLRTDLERELKARNLETRVCITGLLPHEHIPPLIREFDIAVAPYSKPNHPFYFSPLKVFEYMACGVPVVAPQLGQLTEVLRDGENGLLYPVGNLDALARQCQRLLDDPGLRRKLGAAAGHEAQERYTWDQNAERVIQLARSLKGSKATPQLAATVA